MCEYRRSGVKPHEPNAEMDNDDSWLQPWLPLMARHSAGRPILELGCGSGRDTATLLAHGLDVVALDLSEEAVAEARLRAPSARIHRQDLQAPFPPEAEGCSVVLASLSLHYFSWPDTLALARRIHQWLPPGGLLVCRLNSTRDVHYGAVGHPEIAPRYYLVDGFPKRFFDADDVTLMFAEGWSTLSCKEGVIGRYEHPKWAWEVVLQRLA